MAGNAVIGALRVVLGADTAALETGLKSAQSSVGRFGSSFGAIAATVAAAAVAMGGGMALAVRSSINHFDDLSKTSQKIGVPVEQLAALRHAAELSDVSSESLTKGLGKLARSVVDAAQGSSTAVEAYRALGISFKDSNGQIKAVGDLLPQIADRFANMKDGSAKTALAMQIFGKAGADLIPLLNGGSAGLKEMTDEAKALGLVISADTGRTAEAFNDNMTRLGRVMTGVANQVAANILPALAQLSQFMIDGAKNSGFLEAATTALTTAFNVVARAAIVVYDNLGLVVKLGAIFIAANIGAAAIAGGIAFVKMAAAIRATALVMAAFDAIRGISMRGILLIAGIVALAAGAFDGFGEKIKSIGDKIANMLPDEVGKTVTELMKMTGLDLSGLTKDLNDWKNSPFKPGGGLDPSLIDKTKNALQSFLDSKMKGIAAFQAEAAAMRESTVEQEKAKIVAEGLAIAKANHITVTDALKLKLQETAAAFAQWNLAATYGKQVFEQTRTPAEQFAATMEQLNLAFQNGQLDPETYARGVAQAQDKLVSANVHAQNLGSALETAFDKALNGGAKLGDILKSLIVDLAKMEAKAAFKTMLYGNAGAGGGFSGVLSSLFGGARAAGGPVASGKSYIVGENGPEMFQPAGAGRIVSNKDMAGTGGGSPFVYNDNRTFNDVTPDIMAKLDARIRALVPVIKQQVMRDLPKQRASNPNFYGAG